MWWGGAHYIKEPYKLSQSFVAVHWPRVDLITSKSVLTTSVLAQCTLPDADALLSAAGQVVVAAHSGARTAHWAVNLEKGARDRAGEDAIASRLLLRCLAHAARLPSAESFNVGLRAGGDGEVQVGRCRHVGRMCYARCLAAPASGLSARPKGCWNVGAGTRGGGSQ